MAVKSLPLRGFRTVLLDRAYKRAIALLAAGLRDQRQGHGAAGTPTMNWPRSALA